MRLLASTTLGKLFCRTFIFVVLLFVVKPSVVLIIFAFGFVMLSVTLFIVMLNCVMRSVLALNVTLGKL